MYYDYRNDTSQHALGVHGGTFDHYFVTNLLLSLFWKKIKIAQHFANVWEKLIASSALCAGTLCCWKMNFLEIWRRASTYCCNSITLR